MSRFDVMVSGLLGDPVAIHPDASGSARKFHREEYFSPEALRLITRIFGADPEDVIPKPVSKRKRCTATGIKSAEQT